MSFRPVVAVAVCLVLFRPVAHPAVAQGADSSKGSVRGVRFSGTIASMETTRPVTQADVRIMYIDSVHNEKSASANLAGEFFIDSTKSHVGITNDSGAFTISNVRAGHYLINVRRLGFAPFEGLLTLDTARVEMELAMTQVIPILSEVRITEKAIDRVEERLQRVGFTDHRHFEAGGIFIDRTEILRRKPTYVSDVLAVYGIRMNNASFTLDRIPVDTATLSNYPMELVIGIEIYRHRSEVPIEYSRTSSGGGVGAYGNAGVRAFSRSNTGIAPATVLIWTYLP